MSSAIDPHQSAVMRLNALSLEKYRQARWAAIDSARDAGLTWREIGEALGVDKSVARRTWVNDGVSTVK